MTLLPSPEDASRIIRFLQDHERWSVYWDKKHGVWRVAEDDPDSDLYAESSDADTVISYITAHAETAPPPDGAVRTRFAVIEPDSPPRYS